MAGVWTVRLFRVNGEDQIDARVPFHRRTHRWTFFSTWEGPTADTLAIDRFSRSTHFTTPSFLY